MLNAGSTNDGFSRILKLSRISGGYSVYLQKLKLVNFRSFENGEVVLRPDLTVFVGENNGGKSNAIDAIRLLTTPLGGRREIYCEPSDVRFQSGISTVKLEAHFTDLSAGQQGRLISAACDSTLTNARFGLEFDANQREARPQIWAGNPGSSPESGAREMIRHVYLPPLRDAKRSLASSNPSRIMALLNHFLGDLSETDLAAELARQQNHHVLDKVNEAVDRGLAELTGGVRRQSATLGFTTDEALIDIARDLRYKLADHGVEPEDLRYSGHGYANLLFMATIAVELAKVDSVDLTLFLVEEPEAHLHPQLQAAVLAFLQARAAGSKRNAAPEGGPAGELQVVVATHSPNLSAWVSSDRIVVFRSTTIQSQSQAQPTTLVDVTEAEGTQAFSANAVPASVDGQDDMVGSGISRTDRRRATQAIPLAELNLLPPERRKVDRYLDVTRAALLFGGRVLLVEGIAEALLLPVIARRHVLQKDSDELRIFQSAVFVPIDGIDFEPFVTLLLTTYNHTRVADRVVVVTDGDKTIRDDGELTTDESEVDDTTKESIVTNRHEEPEARSTPGESRKVALQELAKRVGGQAQLEVVTNTYSLEAELIEAGNEGIMRKAFTHLHPRSEEKWDRAVSGTGDVRAKRVQALFKNTRKGDFAQVLAGLIETGEDFVVPAYIRRAIEAVVSQ